MSRALIKQQLLEAFEQGSYVTLDRKPVDEFGLDGFVVGLSDTLLLLHVVDGHDLRLNGYTVIRIKDVISCRIDDSFIERYLRLRGVSAVALLQIDLRDLPSVLSSMADHYRLLTIETGLVSSGCCYIGRLEKVTKQCARIKTVDTQARWDTVDDFKVKDITQVTFEDGYTKALEWLIARDEEAKQAE